MTESHAPMPVEVDVEVDDCWNRIGVWRRGSEVCPKLEQVIHCQNCSVFATTGRRLLNRTTPSGYLSEATENYRSNKKLDMQENVSCIIFRLGDEWYALPTHVFKEITEMREVHTVPHRKTNVLRGMVNIRGELHLCVSLGNLFELNKAEDPFVTARKIHERLIVVGKDEQYYVFPVSEIFGIYHYNPDDLKDPPATNVHAGTTYIKGVLDHNDNRVGCIDVEPLFQALAKKIG